MSKGKRKTKKQKLKAAARKAKDGKQNPAGLSLVTKEKTGKGKPEKAAKPEGPLIKNPMDPKEVGSDAWIMMQKRSDLNKIQKERRDEIVEGQKTYEKKMRSNVTFADLQSLAQDLYGTKQQLQQLMQHTNMQVANMVYRMKAFLKLSKIDQKKFDKEVDKIQAAMDKEAKDAWAKQQKEAKAAQVKAQKAAAKKGAEETGKKKKKKPVAEATDKKAPKKKAPVKKGVTKKTTKKAPVKKTATKKTTKKKTTKKK